MGKIFVMRVYLIRVAVIRNDKPPLFLNMIWWTDELKKNDQLNEKGMKTLESEITDMDQHWLR